MTDSELANDRTLRAVVLSGEGRAFSAGLDFSSFQSMAGGERSGGFLGLPQGGAKAGISLAF